MRNVEMMILVSMLVMLEESIFWSCSIITTSAISQYKIYYISNNRINEQQASTSNIASNGERAVSAAEVNDKLSSHGRSNLSKCN